MRLRVDCAFRSGVMALCLTYVARVHSTLSVWLPDTEPLPPKPCSVQAARHRASARCEHAPVSAKKLRCASPLSWRIVPCAMLQLNLVLALCRRAYTACFAVLLPLAGATKT